MLAVFFENSVGNGYTINYNIDTKGGICLMKKILIISPNYQEDKCYVWINQVKDSSHFKGSVAFDYISPDTQISENVTLYDCLAIKEMLCQTDLSCYEGMILIHGTEYIPFTAAALNLLLTHVTIPLVIITQNALLGQRSSFRMECFAAAVTFIQSVRLPGVYNIIKNELPQTLEVHYGSRISQKAPFDFQYIDMISGRFGEIANDTFQFLHGFDNPSVKSLTSMPRSVSGMKTAANVMFIRSYRRMPYHYYNFARSKPDAVLQELFDVTSILNNEGLNSLTAFSEHCRQHDVPLYLCPLVHENLDYEDVFAPVLENGAVLIRNTTVFSAYAKLVYGYGDGNYRQYLDTDFAFEHFSPEALAIK